MMQWASYFSEALNKAAIVALLRASLKALNNQVASGYLIVATR